MAGGRFGGVGERRLEQGGNSGAGAGGDGGDGGVAGEPIADGHGGLSEQPFAPVAQGALR